MLVLLLKDTYGIRYATDPRRVNEAQEIYSIVDDSNLFAAPARFPIANKSQGNQIPSPTKKGTRFPGCLN